MKLILIILFCLLFELNQITGLSCKNGKKLMGMKKLSDDDKKNLLDAHNKLRNFLASGRQAKQPPAENMMELTWDNYAEKLAYSLASTCIFEHDSPKYFDNTPMGQNLFIKMYSLPENVNKTFDKWYKSMIKGWYDEQQLYKFGDLFSPDTGHYTQLIWSKTAKLGCAYSYYQDSGWSVGYLVCNYSPAGNYIGINPYVRGKTNCKKYNLEPSTNYSHLCVKPE